MPVEDMEEDANELDSGSANGSHSPYPNMAESLQRLFYNLQTSDSRYVSLII